MTATLLHRWMDGEPALEELGLTLRDIAGRGGRLLSAQKLKTGVYRIAVTTARRRLSVVAKRLTPSLAHRNQLALERWLPAAGLERIAPGLIGIAADRAGGVVWHLYEDLGGSTLEHCASTRPEVKAAIRLIADLHARFAGDSALLECRVWGEDHGMAFYDRNVREAIAAVGAALATVSRSRDNDAARALLERLECLADERDDRARVLREFGGPDTLLHGDLWLKNVAVLSHFGGQDGVGRPAPAIRLIDWDHVGPGPFSYDLSTLFLRFPADQRPTIVALYRAAAAGNGIDVPADEYLRVLFTTAECARIASEAGWTALVVASEGSRWACDQLADINEWFERLLPRS
jgi:Ser/Thr protein kinase RdoA (MazF antagonist)